MSKTAKTIVHVNQHMLKYNKKHRTEFPVLTVKHRGKTYYAHEVIYHDHSTTIGSLHWINSETSELVKEADAKFDVELGHTIDHETKKAARGL